MLVQRLEVRVRFLGSLLRRKLAQWRFWEGLPDARGDTRNAYRGSETKTGQTPLARVSERQYLGEDA
jgi:hypothetical protein